MFEDSQKWARGVFSNPNLLINGDFQVWQRGTEFSEPYNQYCADRWIVQTSALVNVSKTEKGVKVNASQDSAAFYNLIQILDLDGDYSFLRGKTLTISVNDIYVEGGQYNLRFL